MDENELCDCFNVQNLFYVFLGYNFYEIEFEYDVDGNLRLDENGELIFNNISQGFSIFEVQCNNLEDNKWISVIGNIYVEVFIFFGLIVCIQIGGNY